MFVAVISQIGSSGIPIVTELTLRIPSAEPVEAHVCGFGAFGEYGIVCDPRCGRVFHLEVRPWLGPDHFNEGLVEGGHLIGSDEDGC